MKASWPPQSQRLSTRLPRSLQKNKENKKESKAKMIGIESSTKYDTWHDCAQHQLWPQVFLYPEQCSWQRWWTWRRPYQACIFFTMLRYFTSCWSSQIRTFPWAILFSCSWLICNELLADYSRNLVWGPVSLCNTQCVVYQILDLLLWLNKVL